MYPWPLRKNFFVWTRQKVRSLYFIYSEILVPYFSDCKQLKIPYSCKLKILIKIGIVKNILSVHWKLNSHYEGECGKKKREEENMWGSAVFWQESDCVGGLPMTCLNKTCAVGSWWEWQNSVQCLSWEGKEKHNERRKKSKRLLSLIDLLNKRNCSTMSCLWHLWREVEIVLLEMIDSLKWNTAHWAFFR